jgi:hypothetical protein
MSMTTRYPCPRLAHRDKMGASNARPRVRRVRHLNRSSIEMPALGAIAGVWSARLMFELPVWEFSATARSGPGQWFAEPIATFGSASAVQRQHRPASRWRSRRVLVGQNRRSGGAQTVPNKCCNAAALIYPRIDADSPDQIFSRPSGDLSRCGLRILRARPARRACFRGCCHCRALPWRSRPGACASA